jgi:methionyl-tRNA formyltransferase
MKNISKAIIFFGTDDFSLITLSNLVGSGYNIVAVVTKPDRKSGRKLQIEPSHVKDYALKNNIEIWQPEKVLEINEKIASLKTEVIGVLVSYGKIIPQSTIDLFSPGIINVHPSLLPKYRGPSPIESVIKNGESITGVSVMQLSSSMDAGPIYGQIVHQLSGNENSIDLRRTLAHVGAMTLITLLPDITNHSIQPIPQHTDEATYCTLLTKDDTVLRPTEMTSVEAERQVRAYLEFPKTKLNILGHNIVITKSHISNEEKSALDIKFKDGKYLSIDELIAPSGNKITAREFINGYS